jgi:hypothetical protein
MTLTTPDWVTDAANRERWRDEEWGEWERLRAQFHDLGVEALTPVDQKVSGVVASGKEIVDLSEPLLHHEKHPVLATLRRLSHRLAEDVEHRLHHEHGTSSG